LPPDTPAAVVERATRPEQRTIDGTIETLPALARVHEVQSPALIVIGAVAALHAELAPALACAGD
jgi:siroheme synthase